jgi:RNAse (barnase) inhibitor barstar
VTCRPEREIDGERFATLDGFFDEVERVLLAPGVYWGRNLDAFNDILRGGFGTPEGGFVLRWRRVDLSRARLGASFDTLVAILRDHGPGGREAEDGVELQLDG